MNLLLLGWCDFFADAFVPFAQSGLSAARVVVQHRGGYALCSEQGEVTAEVTGRFRHGAAATSDFPVVGDWVAIGFLPDEDKAVIHAVLPRRSKFSRMAAGDTTEEQVLAANIDDVLIVAALASELNPRRIERYLTLAGHSGARPGVVLSKTDLAQDVPGAVASIEKIAPDVPVFAISSTTGDGLEPLRSHLCAGRTAVLLGPSGVGKSTLINRLCGNDFQAVQPVRAWDDKGRHTTTCRELICLPSGGLIIDTPGLRELQVWEGETGLGEAFADIENLAAGCRFVNCLHEGEPGCAVRDAVAAGNLDPARLESHRKLKREMAYFERRYDARAQAQLRRRSKSATKRLRAFYKVNED